MILVKFILAVVICIISAFYLIQARKHNKRLCVILSATVFFLLIIFAILALISLTSTGDTLAQKLMNIGVLPLTVVSILLLRKTFYVLRDYNISLGLNQPSNQGDQT